MKSHMKPRRKVPRRKPILVTLDSEQVAGVEDHQVVVELRIDRHVRHDADPQAQPHVGLDHVGIGRGEYHLGHQAALAEGFVELGRPVKPNT